MTPSEAWKDLIALFLSLCSPIGAEPTDNKFMLAWDLCRLGHFPKEMIHTTNNLLFLK